MMTTSTDGSKGTAVVSAASIASFCATLLAVDNTLGFAGFHLLGFGVAPFIGALAVLVAVACIVFAVRARDLLRGVAAASVIGFALTVSPALATTLWFLLSTTLQVLVPLGFAACAVIAWLGAARTVPRTVSVVTAVVAVAWAVGAFVPVWLEVFLTLQAVTLLGVTILVSIPLVRRVVSFVRQLGDGAAIR